MLTLRQIEQQYPESLRIFKRHMLREYIQYKILEIIFLSKFAIKLSFLGGTALRIIYGNTRFSEDLDFDNFGLSKEEFSALAGEIKNKLSAEGLETETSIAGKTAYRCRVRLPNILFAEELTPHYDEKILVQIDSFAHEFEYSPDRKILNKFDVFSEVFVTPPDILLSQKIYAALNRKRVMGRDFYDIVFLLSFAKPNYAYLKFKLGIGDADALKKQLLAATANLDFAALERDVRQFLFNADDVRKIELFPEFIATAALA